MTGFVHLRVHTEFSLVDSVVRIPKLMAGTVDGGMPAVALTDQSNMFALVKFYRAAVNKGVKPLIGVDAWVANEAGELSPMVLLAQTMEGYLNLSQLVSRSYQEGQTVERAVVHFEWLDGKTKDIIALSGGRDGDIGRALLAENHDEARLRLNTWRQLFKDAFYIELQRTGRDNEESYNQAAIKLAGAVSYTHLTLPTILLV